MKKFRDQLDRRQIALLPASIEEYIPKDDLVRYIDAMIDELDLSYIESSYSAFGRPAYHPRDLVKLLLYGKMRGIRSSRELSRATRENLRFIFLCNNEKPDFRTIINFRSRFHKELGSLLKQTIGIGLREAIIKLEHVSIDGTKLRAFAGRDSFKDPKKLEKDLEKLEQEISQSISEDIEVDREEDDKYGDDDSEQTLPPDLQNKKALSEKIKSALRHYRELETEKPKIVSTTDPESRYMKAKGKGTLPSYNGQAAVDRDSGMVVGGLMTNSCTDNGQLKPMLKEIEENTGRNPREISADKGYGAIEGFVDLKRREIEGYIPIRAEPKTRYTLEDFEYNEEDDSYSCPNNRVLRLIGLRKKHRHYRCENCMGCLFREECTCSKEPSSNKSLTVSIYSKIVEEMKAKAATEKGKAMAKVRCSTVEPVFGCIKYCKKLTQLIFRGLRQVNSMWKMELAAYNVEKMARRLQVHDLQLVAS